MSYLARLVRIEIEERAVKLVSRDEVQVAAFTKARNVRDRLLNLPDGLAVSRLLPDLAAMPVTAREATENGPRHYQRAPEMEQSLG